MIAKYKHNSYCCMHSFTTFAFEQGNKTFLSMPDQRVADFFLTHLAFAYTVKLRFWHCPS